MRPRGFSDAILSDPEPATRHFEDSGTAGRDVRRVLTENWLNRVLADCHVLAALHRKQLRTARSSMDPNLRAVLNEHAEQQERLVDELVDRVRAVGGVAAVDARNTAELTCIPRAPDGAESARGAVSRLLQAQDITLRRARAGVSVLGERGDRASSELLEFRVVRTVEEQVRELVGLLEGTSPGEAAGER